MLVAPMRLAQTARHPRGWSTAVHVARAERSSWPGSLKAYHIGERLVATNSPKGSTAAEHAGRGCQAGGAPSRSSTAPVSVASWGRPRRERLTAGCSCMLLREPQPSLLAAAGCGLLPAALQRTPAADVLWSLCQPARWQRPRWPGARSPPARRAPPRPAPSLQHGCLSRRRGCPAPALPPAAGIAGRRSFATEQGTPCSMLQQLCRAPPEEAERSRRNEYAKQELFR